MHRNYEKSGAETSAAFSGTALLGRGLCNGGVRASKRAYKVAEVYLERSIKPKQSASDVSTHPEQLQLLLGTYRAPNKREVCRITMEEKRLRADFGEVPWNFIH